MLSFLRRNWIHFALWGGMFLYLIFARDLYNQFFLRNGKPVLVDAELPVRNDRINSSIDVFKPTSYDGEYVYSVMGWSFSKENRKIPPEDYNRQIVLVADKRNYVFPTESYPRPDISKTFTNYKADLLNAGFKAKLSPSVIKPGVYQIGFIFHNPINGKSFYSLSDRYIIRTSNQIKISDKAALP
jgi:hypothetical protein